MKSAVMEPPIARVSGRGAAAEPLLIHFDESCGEALRQVLTGAPALFAETDAADARVVIFGDDEIGTIARSPLYRAHGPKCICISETDTPTFRLPALYAANRRGVLSASRTRTISYFMWERAGGNPEVTALVGRDVPKRYLYSFMGSTNSWPRKRLVRSLRSGPDTLVEATNWYAHWMEGRDGGAARGRQRKQYAAVMAASKFALCPRGCGLSSYRLFESMALGVCPVIIADRWRPIEGIDWSFAIFVPERRVPQIDRILRAHEAEWRDRGRAAQAVYARTLAPDAVAAMVRDGLADLVASYDPVREAVMVPVARAGVVRRQAWWTVYGWMKRMILWGFHLTGRPFPVTLRHPLEQQIKSRRRQ